MYKRILAPLDGSEFSECSLEHVRAIATGCQVPEVILLRVIEPLHQTYEVDEDYLRNAQERAKTEMESYLAKTAGELKKDGIAATTAVVAGRPADEILDFANKNRVDLIIMSTHGRTGVARWTLGSVADRVLRHSVAPVLIASPSGCRIRE